MMIADTKEITGRQAISMIYGDGILQRDTARLATYAIYRTIRKDATVALGRGLVVSGVLASSWSVDADEDVDDDVVGFIADMLMPMREDVERAAVAFGRIDFGWMGWEKIFGVKGGRIVLERLKPLLHDITAILIDANGNFKGYRQRTMSALPIDIPVEKCLRISFDVEGGNLYGIPLLENVRAIQTAWDDCNTYASKYDVKLAGSNWVVHYPPGSSTVNGETIDNGDVAAKMLNALESSGSISMPSTVADVLQEIENAHVANLYAWKVELLSDANPKQISFIDRLKYLDTLKIRGLILPERALLEGQYGTKAESEAHADLAITNMEAIDKQIVKEMNRQVVNQLLALNFGEALIGKVRILASPLVDEKIGFLRKVYLALISGAAQGTADVDMQVLKEQLNIPAIEDESDD